VKVSEESWTLEWRRASDRAQYLEVRMIVDIRRDLNAESMSCFMPVSEESLVTSTTTTAITKAATETSSSSCTKRATAPPTAKAASRSHVEVYRRNLSVTKYSITCVQRQAPKNCAETRKFVRKGPADSLQRALRVSQFVVAGRVGCISRGSHWHYRLITNYP